jgi:hypothetical protein
VRRGWRRAPATRPTLKWPTVWVYQPVAESPTSPTWSSNEDSPEVPPIWHSSVAAADVEAVPVAPAQPEGDASSAAGRTGMPGLWVAWSESWTPGLCVACSESWPSCGARPKSVKQVMKVLQRARRSDRLGWRSGRQPLFSGQSDGLDWQSNRQPLFHGWSDCLVLRSDHQPLFPRWSDCLD